MIRTIRGARTVARPDGCDLTLADGMVTAVGASSKAGHGFEAAGRVVVPALVDAHVHLDKAFLLPESPEPHLESALKSVAVARTSMTAADVERIARRAVDALVRNGTTAARAQVELDPVVGLDLLTMHQQLAGDVAGRLSLQLVAFPQAGLEAPGMPHLLREAMAQGAQVVGGCPYLDADPVQHLDTVFATAERWRAPIDLHLDFNDDASGSLIPLVVERTKAHGMSGRVTIGHVTALAAMSTYDQLVALESLAGAGISLVVLPATDLYLVGHGEPGVRSVAPFERAMAAGVRTAIGNNNIANAFAPFGNASLLQAAWLAGLTRRTAGAQARADLLAAITSEPAAILDLPSHGTEVGDVADLAVLECDDVGLAVLQAPAVSATFKRGRLLEPWVPRAVS